MSTKTVQKFTFDPIPSTVSFPKIELEILSYWKRINAFKRSLELSKGRKPFSFYDGPPFATGLPHYGHILAGTIKDVVTRYASQTGHHVERRFGWDTHGLPVEFEIDKNHNIKTRDDVLKMGIANYNKACRAIVMRYSKEWESIVTRCGRWIDFENDYKTLDLSFMESVWWVFKTVFDKSLIYRGYKIMPFSTRLGTPLSNFESNLNYKDVTDPAVIVKFPLQNEPETSLLAWTTTPWTLPSNLALCVRADLVYVRIRDAKTGEKWVLAESRLCELYKKPREKRDFEIIERFSGDKMVGKTYLPPFDYFLSFAEKGAFRILSDDYVTDKSGTGIVHQAPGFGEDDFRVCLKNGILSKNDPVPSPVDSNGAFTSQIGDFAGIYVKDADRPIIKRLRAANRLAKESQQRHSYPFCWRSDTPLIYKAVPSWFLNVEKIKEKLIANTEKTSWVPSYVKDKRFANWLKDARDWAISRSRFWGTPLPVWANSDFSEIVVIGSVEELERLSGKKGIKDLHRETIDDIKIPSKDGKGTLNRIEEVFDCWFESGSMPYAQLHYPFENKEKFKNTFPADFIAEGLDQTRGWFYTLMVLSTALFEQPAFKNLICNGLVLAEDGKKMSKRLNNYPDPSSILEKYGADALRLYLINSPVVRAESLRFSEKGVFQVLKDVFLLWQNTFRFFVENASRFEKTNKTKFESDEKVYEKTTNVFDKWIISELQSLIETVRNEMAQYRLYNVTPPLVRFLNLLSLWHVRFNRERMKGFFGKDAALHSLQTLYHCLVSLCRLMSPFAPFISEKMYLNLKNCHPRNAPENKESVHFLQIPQIDENAKNIPIQKSIRLLRTVIELGRSAREAHRLKIKQPLAQCVIVHSDLTELQNLTDFVKKELNVRAVLLRSKIEDYAELKAAPNRKSLGLRLRGRAKAVSEQIANLCEKSIFELKNGRRIEVGGETVFPEDVEIELKPKSVKSEHNGNSESKFACASDKGICVFLDTNLTESLKLECLSREFSSRVQKLKKESDLAPMTPINVFFDAGKGRLSDAIRQFDGQIKQQIGHAVFEMKIFDDYLKSISVVINEIETTIEGNKLKLLISRPTIIFSNNFLQSKEKDVDKENALKFASTKRFSNLANEVNSQNGELRIRFENRQMRLKRGKDFFLTIEELIKSL